MTAPHRPEAAGGSCHPAAALSPPPTGLLAAEHPRQGGASPKGLSPPSTTLPRCSAWGGCMAAALGLHEPTSAPQTGIAGAPRLDRACRAAPSSCCNLAASHTPQGAPPPCPSPCHASSQPNTATRLASLCRRVPLPSPASWLLGPGKRGWCCCPARGRCCVPREQ